MATQLTKLDPMRATRIAGRAAETVPLCGRQQKHIARAAGVTDQAVTNWKQGATYGPFYDAIEAADRAGRMLSTDKTDPYPLLVEMEVVVMEANLEHRSDAELVREWRRMYEGEAEHQANEDAASARFVFRRNLRDLSAAHKREAAYQMRFAAICEILDRRGIDPLDDEWDWVDRQ